MPGHERTALAPGTAEDQVHQAVVEVGLVHRLREVARDARHLGLAPLTGVAEGGEEHQLHGGDLRIGLDGPGQGEPVHPRHLHVEHGQLPGRARLRGQPQGAESGLAVLGTSRAQTPVGELLPQDGPVRLVVVHDEHAVAGQGDPRHLGHGPRARRPFEPRREPERAALARHALHPDLAPHARHQLLGDGETETRASVAPRGGSVRLDEGLEEARLGLSGDADAGVADLEAQARPLRPRPCVGEGGAQHHLALLRELHRVAHEVAQHLAQAARVAPQEAGDVGVDETGQLQPLGVGLLLRGVHHLANGPPQVELDALQLEAAGLDLREVEDVVDDLQEGVPRARR